ncbi:MAG: SUMF1/EgtB/PvdO family nonheme iron enzyme, partial [Planctomycetaceae bacterium]
PKTGSSHVSRGGSWGYGPYSVRCAYRCDTPGNRLGNGGFRLVLE